MTMITNINEFKKSITENTITDKQKVTIYTTSEFMGSVVKREGILVDFGIRKYAQYNKAPFVNYIPTGKRKQTGFIKGFNPYLVILKGFNNPDPESMMNKGTTDANGTTISQSRYLSFDDRYKTDFDSVLNEFIKNNPDAVLMDVRHTQNTNVINK